jgi:hypothetical protein
MLHTLLAIYKKIGMPGNQASENNRHSNCIIRNMITRMRAGRTFLIFFITAAMALTLSRATYAVPPQAKFFPLNREVQQQGIQPAAKFIPLNKGKPIRLMFSSSKKNIIHTGDKQPLPLVREKREETPLPLSEGSASQLLSIYEPVD